MTENCRTVWLTLVGLVLIFLVGRTTAQPSNNTLLLTATIRDFLANPDLPGALQHPDFEKKFPLGPDPGLVRDFIGSDRKPIYADHPDGTVTTTGRTWFDLWWRSSQYAQELPYTLVLSRVGSSEVFSYHTTEFFPIDDQGWGNWTGIPRFGPPHNFHFTLESHSVFTYIGGETFSFIGDDDVFVFINNQLLIDLGGVHFPLNATIELDTLGLVLGQDYTFDFFFAERHCCGSEMRIDTSIRLRCPCCRECVPLTPDCEFLPDASLCPVLPCQQAVCLQSGCQYTPLSCDDGNLCTEDSCDINTGMCINDLITCEDFDECTNNLCNPNTGQCFFPQKSCDDGNPCTQDSCSNGVCSHQVRACDNGNPCNLGSCNTLSGECEYVERSCDDGNLCTTDSCQVNNSTSFTCVNQLKTCNDSLFCTTDFCNPNTGLCETTPLDCVEPNACSRAECNEALRRCTLVDFKDCNDDDGCTTDYCDPATSECVNNPVDCSGDDPCLIYSCAATGPRTFACETAPKCVSDDPCSVASCSNGVCSFVAKNCDDGIDCTIDSCNNSTGVCEHVDNCNCENVDCNDNNGCTIDLCDSNLECFYQDVVCQAPDLCSTSTCVATGIDSHQCQLTYKDCDDNNPCTSDSCDGATGLCINNETNCNDNNICTLDGCGEGLCFNVQVLCDDEDECTLDFCTDCNSGECVTETDLRRGYRCDYADVLCEEGNLCQLSYCNTTTGCQLEALDCDDGLACTEDSCDPAVGCVNTPLECENDPCAPSTCMEPDGCTSTEICPPSEDICLVATCEVVDGGPVCGEVDRCECITDCQTCLNNTLCTFCLTPSNELLCRESATITDATEDCVVLTECFPAGQSSGGFPWLAVVLPIAIVLAIVAAAALAATARRANATAAASAGADPLAGAQASQIYTPGQEEFTSPAYGS